MDQKRKRVKTILDSLKELCYTGERRISQLLTADAGYKLETEFVKERYAWTEFAPDQTWGGHDRHYWFYTRITVEEDQAGAALAASLYTGQTDIWNTDNPQVIVYVNGRMSETMDMNHNRMLLTGNAAPGQVFELAFYAYSNQPQCSNFFDVTTAVYHKDVEKLYYDLKVLWEAADLLPEDDLERIRTFELLNTCVNYLDLRRTDVEEFYRSVSAADTYLWEHYYQKEHPVSSVCVYSTGHTHIDVAWKWPLRQTRQKAVRSFQTVLNLMERYPEYRFMSSQPQLYQFVKEDAPQLYEKIKERVSQGRWETEGAMWLEADCNLISGESMIRQILYGRKFFKEEFGTQDQEVLWLPDVFGYSVAMPQIMKQAGIKYFMTTKIGWNEYNQIPNDTMMWRGLDGSEILTYFITTSDYCPHPDLHPERSFSTTYNGMQNVSQVMGTWQRYQNKELSEDVLTCYGYGDGGGGATAQMLEESRRMELGVLKCPRTRQASVKEFFHRLEKNLEGRKTPVWSGELYLEFHRGTYTSMARNKKYNRQCEFLNAEAEFFCILAKALGSETGIPAADIEKAWKLTLLNQFHDILPGSSCKEVYEDSDRQYEEIYGIDRRLIGRAQKDIVERLGREIEGCRDREPCLAVFNQLGFKRTGLVCIPEELGEDCAFESVQRTWDGRLLFLAEEAASMGVKVYGLRGLKAQAEPVASHIKEQGEHLCGFTTLWYEFQLSCDGEILSLYDREAEREVLKSGETGNRLTVFEDRPAEYDAWNIDAYYEEKCWDLKELDEIRLVDNGPLRATVMIKRTFLQSSVVQYIHFYAHTKRIDFETSVDWRESQLLLKVAFPMDILADKAVYEVQFGSVERPTHSNTSWDQARFEVCAHKWADISEFGYGAALLNDCKYGYDIHDSVMRLTLIKSGIFPNPEADQEMHHMTYSLYPHKGDYREGRVMQEARDLNCPLYAKPIEGGQGLSYSYLELNTDHVFADTVKVAEDGRGTIVRCYEAYGKRGNVLMHLPFADGKAVEECDCMERVLNQPHREQNGVSFEIRPYEIKTFYIHD